MDIGLLRYFSLIRQPKITRDNIGVQQISSGAAELLISDDFLSSRHDLRKIFYCSPVASRLIADIQEQAKPINRHRPHLGNGLLRHLSLVRKSLDLPQWVILHPLEILAARIP